MEVFLLGVLVFWGVLLFFFFFVNILSWDENSWLPSVNTEQTQAD